MPERAARVAVQPPADRAPGTADQAVEPADLSDPGGLARAVFGDRLELARHYAVDLATTAVEHGVIGPREIPRLWARHLVNSAVLATLIPRGCTVCDVGSGAGLPGVALAIVRPDLQVTLVEPLARRVAYLTRVVADLHLPSVQVIRGRVDGRGEVVLDATGVEHPVGPFDVVTARAVAGLDKLLGWLLPLARPRGLVLALKGRSATTELAGVADQLARTGAIGRVVELGEPDVDAGTETVRVVRVDVGPRRKDGPVASGPGEARPTTEWKGSR